MLLCELMAVSLAKVQWINKGPQSVHLNIEAIEKAYKAFYVADLCLKSESGVWTQTPFSVFWQSERPKPEFSHYFGVGTNTNGAYIVTGKSVEDTEWSAAEAENGEIIFSRFRHDNRVSSDGTAMVDGGRDYFRYRGKSRTIKLIGSDFHIL